MNQMPSLSLKNRICQRLLPRIRPAFIAALLKRIMNVRRIQVETANGRFLIDPVSNLGLALCRCGEYESEMTRTLQNLLRPGSVFMDLGANEGFFTVVGARLVGPDGRVIAIEPQSRLLSIVEANCTANGVGKIVEVVNVAISDKSGRSVLFLTSDLNSGASGLSRATRYPLPTQQVNTLTLAELVSRLDLSRIDLLKVDIEGYEYEAILGSQQLFRDGVIRAIALALHPGALRTRGLDPDAILAFLESCGFKRNTDFSNLVYCL
jgi:FkbM family methyltransferase